MCHDALILPSVSISWKHEHLRLQEFIYWDKNTFVFKLSDMIFEIRRRGMYFDVLVH